MGCRFGILSLLEMVTIYRANDPMGAIELYDALVAAGAPEEKSRAAVADLPGTEYLATQKDVADVRGNLANLRSLLEDGRSVVVTPAELHRSQRELKADLNAER